MMDKKVVFGGGCFWCTEAMFRELKGVSQVRSGYSGGPGENPTYREVCGGRTGHAEVIEVTYDPSVISYVDLLIIHLTTHDPTQLNRQGADRGTQYRSIIFYDSAEEKALAEEVLMEVQKAYDNKIVTELSPAAPFYVAEADHQDYYQRNKYAGYCMAVIDPKLRRLRKLHTDKLHNASVS
ncbi:MAG: peptide-methionine (S)-S-oxide reductase MsrA [Cyclobacteriaceae bacterium]